MPHGHIRDMPERAYFGIKYKIPAKNDLLPYVPTPIKVFELNYYYSEALFG
jgi:hypothetical protein